VRVVWKFSGRVRPRQPYRVTVLPQPLAAADTAKVTITEDQQRHVVFDGPVTGPQQLSGRK
jgi:hypothetical protein